MTSCVLSALVFICIFSNTQFQSLTFSRTVRYQNTIRSSISILNSFQPPEIKEFDKRVSTKKINKHSGKHSFETFVLALEYYKRKYQPNDEVVNVPRNFTVPAYNKSTTSSSNDDDINYWPEITQGLKLGMKAQFIRTRNLHNETSQINILQGLGFVVDPQKNRTDLLISTLQTFRATYGHLLIPKSYKVPHGDKRFNKGLFIHIKSPIMTHIRN